MSRLKNTDSGVLPLFSSNSYSGGSMSHTVRSADVGFGFTKFSKGRDGDGQIRCSAFPSFAPMASVNTDMTGGVVSKRDTVTINIGTNKFEVGYDVEYALDNADTRVLHEGYTRTPEYLALLRGALHYMSVKEIDLLIVGLPVSHLNTNARDLVSRMTGLHNTGNGKTVSVRSVKVIAQPIGGFIDYAWHNDLFDKVDNQMSLIIDPGFFTFDWVVARGIRPIVPRCGHQNGSVSMVLSKIADAISRKFKIHYTDFNQIDRGLREGIITVNGETVQLEEFMMEARQAMQRPVTAMMGVIGKRSDINNIVLVGGGATLFQPVISETFPSQKIIVVDDAVYANVRGFQLAGELIMRKKAVA
ncbi:MAG: PRTRC system protein D [Sulfuricaulis sp.]